MTNWFTEFVENITNKGPFKIGDVVTHPSGKRVKIVGGTYWGERGLCNFWSWREVFPNCTLGPVQTSFGWCPKTAQQNTKEKLYAS